MEWLKITALQIASLMKMSKRNAQRILAKTKTQLGKETSQYVTPKEFCEVTGLDLELVLSMMNKLFYEDK